LLAALQEAIGDLNDARRIVKLVVFVNHAPHFTEPHVVANGASELLLEVFGDRGAHARSALVCRRFRLDAALRLKWSLMYLDRMVRVRCKKH
jgi:enamine deaminase RidA (YjgF/YER057c/UK114 family)